MMRVVFRAPSQSDIEDLAKCMRDVDVLECKIVSGRTPKEALEEGVNNSTWSCAAEIDGKVVSIFGLGEASMLGNDGYPWMLCAKGIERHARTLLTVAPRFVGEMKQQCEHLSNAVHADNHAAIRFVKWCGFSFGQRLEVKGEPFLAFSWSREEHREAA